MTAVASIYTGGRILASAGRNAWPQAVIKAIDETEGAFGAPVMVNDRELYLPVAASTSYLFCCYLNYEGYINNDGDLQYEWVVPSGMTLRFSSIGLNLSAGSQVKTTLKENTVYQLGTNGAGVLVAALMFGTLVTSTAAGTLQLSWTTYQDHFSATTIHAQSFLALWQVSP